MRGLPNTLYLQSGQKEATGCPHLPHRPLCPHQGVCLGQGVGGAGPPRLLPGQVNPRLAHAHQLVDGESQGGGVLVVQLTAQLTKIKRY